LRCSLLLLALVALLATGCGSVSSGPPVVSTYAGPPERVVVGHTGFLNFAGLYSAIDNGFMRRQGIEVDLRVVVSGSEAAKLLARGQLDVAGIGLAARTFNAINRGNDMRIVASAGVWGETHDTMILGQGDKVRSGELQGLVGLRGRKVAVNGGPGSAAAYLLELALEGVGLTVRDIQMVNVPSLDIAAALQRGSVDAAIVGVPYSRQAVAEGWGVPLLRNFAPGNATSAYVYSSTFMKERPGLAQRFMIALVQGTRAIQGAAYFSERNMASWSRYTGVSAAIIREAEPLRYPPDLTIARESIIKQERIHRELGYTDYDTPIPIARMIDESFARQAVVRLGPYRP
jgi:ABC-type nitrate/sulfonate/bicarbonate transport system substrate-binding protein